MLKVKSFYAGVVYLTNEYKKLTLVSKSSKVVQDGSMSYEMFYNTTDIPGVINYGMIQLEDDWEKKAGYIWSSRPSCINKLWRTRFIEASIDNVRYAIDADLAAALLEQWYKEQGKEVEVHIDLTKETEEDLAYRLRVVNKEPNQEVD